LTSRGACPPLLCISDDGTELTSIAILTLVSGDQDRLALYTENGTERLLDAVEAIATRTQRALAAPVGNHAEQSRHRGDPSKQTARAVAKIRRHPLITSPENGARRCADPRPKDRLEHF
jgi:hypothetical protein